MSKLVSAAVVAVALIVNTQSPDARADEPRLPSLDNYPPAVTRHLLDEFALQQQALETSGVPANEEELAAWNACASSDENAHPRYVAAFGAKVHSERLRLLSEAAALPCYQYSVESGFFSWLFGSADDVYAGMREASRLLSSEISVQTALGDTERAVEYAEAGFGMMGHFAKAPVTLVQLSRYACQELLLGSFQDLLSCTTLTDAQLVRLDSALTRAYDPTVLARTWIGEKVVYEQTDPFEACATIHIFEARSRAQLLAARTAVAVERFRLAQGAMPAALSDLVPTYLPEVPKDPFNSKELHFSASDEAYAVFSVDDDGVACPEPFEAVRRDERSMISIPVVKKTKPLSELFYEAPTGSGEGNTRAEKKAIGNVASLASKGLSMKEIDTIQLSAGEIDGGIAVMLDSATAYETKRIAIPVLAAFWVHDGAIHTVNAWAKDLAPDLPQAPAAITFDRVRDVVR